MTSLRVFKTGLISLLTITSINSVAFIKPGISHPAGGPLNGNVIAAIQNQSRNASVLIQKNLIHGEVLLVRKLLVGLLKGDFVASIDIEAQATQPGAYLEIIVDQNVVGQLQLGKNLNTVSMPINLRNGVDYQRLAVRAIGSVYVRTLTTQIDSADVGEPLPPLPPPPPGQQPPPYHPPGNQPPPYNPPQNPGNGYSLAGYCEDYDHSQFQLARNFAYATAGINMNDADSVNWALNYNRSHACGTFSEFSSRFTTLKNFAYATEGLNMNAPDSIQYAFARVESQTAVQTQALNRIYTAIKNFSYATTGLNLNGPDSIALSRQWIERGYCENESGIAQVSQQYTKEYNFAYATSGLNYNAIQAKQYAMSRVRGMSRCGDLFR